VAVIARAGAKAAILRVVAGHDLAAVAGTEAGSTQDGLRLQRVRKAVEAARARMQGW
jgi:hypothetical protein